MDPGHSAAPWPGTGAVSGSVQGWQRGAARLWPVSILLVLSGVAALWIISMQNVQLTRINDYGLAPALPIGFYLALAILTLSFAASLFRPAPVWVLLPHLILLVLILDGTPAITYDTVRYGWIWQHVGVIEYFQHHAAPNPAISVHNPSISQYDIYQNWPGFFVFGALLTEVAGYKSALSFANWVPIFINLMNLGAVLLIYRTFTADRRLIWLAAWIFTAGNWIAQDTLVPQATCFFLYLVIVGILLRWPGRNNASDARWYHSIQRLLPPRFRGALDHPRPVPMIPPLLPSQHRAVMGIVAGLLFVIVSTHQLTPFMTITALVMLALIGRFRVRGLLVLVIAMTVGWLAIPAAPFVRENLHLIFGFAGNIAGNVGSNLTNPSEASRGQKVVDYASRGLTASVAILALLGAIRRYRQGYWDLPCVLLALTPLPLPLLTRYGHEIIFRVYLFGLPFLAFFAAAALYPSVHSRRSWGSSGLVALLSGVLLVGFIFSSYGVEEMNYFSKNEVAASNYLYGKIPFGSYIVEGSDNYPTLYQNYNRYVYAPIAQMLPTTRQAVMRDPVHVLSRWMSAYPSSYAIFTKSQEAEATIQGLMPRGAITAIQEKLVHSPQFRVVYQNGDAVILVQRKRHA